VNLPSPPIPAGPFARGPDAPWSSIAEEARAGVAAAVPGYRRTAMVAALAALVALPFSLPLGVALALLAGLFYAVVVRPAATANPQVFIGPVVGRRMWRKVWDANEGSPHARNRVEIAHFAKWMLIVSVDARVELAPAAAEVQSQPTREMDFAVPRELFTNVGDGERIGMIITPANDLLGYVASDGRPVWFDVPLDQSWKRGGYKVLDDPEAWPD
jgi:hypothetical protein